MGFEDLANMSGKGGSVFDQAFGGNSSKGGSVFDQAFGGSGSKGGSVLDQAFGGNGSQEVNLLKSNYFNIKAQNLGNAGLLESKMGLIAKREDLNFGDISLAEMYNDKAMDTRAMGGLYNVTLSDMYSDKKTFLATQGALTMGGLILEEDNKEIVNQNKSIFIPEVDLQENIYNKKENKTEEVKIVETNKTTDILKKEEIKENNSEIKRVETNKTIEIKQTSTERKETKSIFLNNDEENEVKTQKTEYKEGQKNTKIKKKKKEEEDEEFVIDTLAITRNSIQENFLKKPKPEKVISDIEAFYKNELEEFLNS